MIRTSLVVHFMPLGLAGNWRARCGVNPEVWGSSDVVTCARCVERMTDAERASSRPEPVTVAEAGRRGGRKVALTHGHEHFVQMGRKGGGRVKALVAAALAAEKGVKP